MRLGLRRSFGCLLFLLLSLNPIRPAAAAVQASAVVRVARENFRKDPNGNPLATVFRGAELAVVAERGGWLQVELEGWIWAPSVTAVERNGFDLRVSAAGGENLRAEPQGRIRARLLEGCLLERLEAKGSWYRVRRRGWIWKASVDVSGRPAAADAAGGSVAAGAAGGAAGAAGAAGPTVLTAPSAVVIYSSPDGDTLAVFRPGGQAQILGRTGDWVRVRVDGWVYGPAALDSALDMADTGDLTPAQLRADPGRYKGALVRWRVQVISLRRAERARADFREGEPFLLARGPAGDAGFVYLAVPESLLGVAEGLEPLDYVTIVGRVRTGRSSQVGSPVIDLTDIETARSEG
jgi:hypothetical protein